MGLELNFAPCCRDSVLIERPGYPMVALCWCCIFAQSESLLRCPLSSTLTLHLQSFQLPLGCYQLHIACQRPRPLNYIKNSSAHCSCTYSQCVKRPLLCTEKGSCKSWTYGCLSCLPLGEHAEWHFRRHDCLAGV